jgi:TRAP-type C4-dicarboxylate transport system permease small subunit
VAAAEDVIGVLLLAAVGAIVLQQVTRRYLLGLPTGWSEEAARVLLAWITFIGASAVWRHDGHPRVLLVRDGLGPRGRRALDAVVTAAVVLLAASSLVYGLLLASQVTTVQLVTLPVSWVWWYGSMPAGAALLLLRVAERWWLGRDGVGGC